MLQVRLGRFILADAVLGYHSRAGLLLPLGGLMAALNFPIDVDVGEGQAEGWFLRENRRFFLDLARGEVVVEGRRSKFPAHQVELHQDDIYVNTEALSKWFPL